MRYGKDNPYGGWIDKGGNLLLVYHEECHAEMALEEILKREPKKYSVYRVMARLGYIRIVFMLDGQWTAEYNSKYTTKKQADWIKAAEMENDLNWPIKK